MSGHLQDLIERVEAADEAFLHAKNLRLAAFSIYHGFLGAKNDSRLALDVAISLHHEGTTELEKKRKELEDLLLEYESLRVSESPQS